MCNILKLEGKTIAGFQNVINTYARLNVQSFTVQCSIIVNLTMYAFLCTHVYIYFYTHTYVDAE